jgi:hypothetical protein
MEDLDALFTRLASSSFRRRFRLGKQDRAYLEARGLSVVLAHARDFIDKRLGPAQPRNDGKQTPYRGHPVFVAQHATATCCRSCLAKWHGMAEGRALEEADKARILAILECWLAVQMRDER